MPSLATQLTFSRRAKVRRTAAGESRRYLSECGRFVVIQAKPVGLLPHWLAVRRLASGEYIISRHRKRGSAEAACWRELQ